jgi:hypothetical protein
MPSVRSSASPARTSGSPFRASLPKVAKRLPRVLFRHETAADPLAKIPSFRHDLRQRLLDLRGADSACLGSVVRLLETSSAWSAA